jgi:type I restriction enzyme M protein
LRYDKSLKKEAMVYAYETYGDSVYDSIEVIKKIFNRRWTKRRANLQRKVKQIISYTAVWKSNAIY